LSTPDQGQLNQKSLIGRIPVLNIAVRSNDQGGSKEILAASGCLFPVMLFDLSANFKQRESRNITAYQQIPEMA
jgi:hypothetical protein